MISLSHHFLFIHIPKTAGNSMQGHLKAYSEDDIVCVAPHQDGVERFEVRSKLYTVHKHSTLADYRAALGRDVLSKLFKFTSVRNPWDRMISYYFSPHRGTVAWNRQEFVALLARTQPIGAYVHLPQDEDREPFPFGNVDCFVRYEYLDDDFRKVCARIGIPWVPLPCRNKSTRGPYADYYDDELEELVRNRFSEEIAYFGYEF